MKIMENNEVSKLKPFDLEKALKGEKVVTRDGREASQFVKMEGIMSPYSVVFVLDKGIKSFREDGRHWGIGNDSSDDLFMAPKERVVWVNFYEANTRLLSVYGNRAAYHLSK